ncbi:ABC-type nitrate/sulfonate/bicarbonate transport system permease component [Nesterenkonia sandarakina]|uniref:ABC-type nitrate/sulfonate/bicarbonate transport system permease component n=2 Tax=Nesterenkonia sandarakina TaxID=272918 RepID=A0A2T0YRR6_9MICC|nr:ABC-type nitrate/sulfonate/bicarbonate transport system permease component [Nesterenkonia sandarakina]
MTDESSSPGIDPRGDAPRTREEDVHRLHRWEASAAADRRGGDIRRHTDVSTSAGLDIATRPDPAAPLTSVAQSGATGRATTSGPGRARRRRRRGLGTKALGAAGVLGMLLTWELLPVTGLVNARFMPPASEAIGGLISNFGLTDFWVAVGDTMRAWALGMIIAVVLATVLGFIIGSSTFLRRFTNSTIEFLRPVPSVALIPLAVLLLGTDIESALMLIVYACFWQVLIQVLYGVADVDSVAMNTARSYGLGPVARIRYVIFPTALPYVMTGVRLAAAVALILAITAGLIIGTPGLGAEISRAQSGGNYVSMYALVLATGLLGVLVNLVMRMIERKILSWHSSVRTEVAA